MVPGLAHLAAKAATDLLYLTAREQPALYSHHRHPAHLIRDGCNLPRWRPLE